MPVARICPYFRPPASELAPSFKRIKYHLRCEGGNCVFSSTPRSKEVSIAPKLLFALTHLLYKEFVLLEDIARPDEFSIFVDVAIISQE